MTTYTRLDLDRIARHEAEDIRKSSGHPAKAKGWSLLLSADNCPCLVVTIQAADGMRQRNVAI